MIQEFQNIFTELTRTQWAVLIAFLVVFVLRFIYLFLFTARVLFAKKKIEPANTDEKISLILTLRNEEEEVKKNLPGIMDWDNVDFELVVIDDFSQDNTLSVLGLLMQRYPRLKISSLNQETRFSIKLAKNIALKSASNNWVLCIPAAINAAKESWLQGFSSQINSPHINLIVGYSTVVREKGFFNTLYRIENFYEQIRSAGYIANGIPFVYAEENLAFKKDKYFEKGGFAKHMQESYANFELVVNSFISKKHTLIHFNRDSVIRAGMPIHKPEYFDLLKKQQRIEKHLPFWKRQILQIDDFSRLFLIPLYALALVFCLPLWPFISALIAIGFIVNMLIIKITLNRLNERKIFIPSLAYGLLMPYYKLFFRWHFSRTSRKHKWRNVS